MSNEHDDGQFHPFHKEVARNNARGMDKTFLIGQQNAQNAADVVRFFGPKQPRK
jgi:hypothetical protein